MDTSEHKEYIFGMLFLKRMSDLFDQELENLEPGLRFRGMAGNLIQTQLRNPNKFTFFVHEEAHWEKIRQQKQDVRHDLLTDRTRVGDS